MHEVSRNKILVLKKLRHWIRLKRARPPRPGILIKARIYYKTEPGKESCELRRASEDRIWPLKSSVKKGESRMATSCRNRLLTSVHESIAFCLSSSSFLRSEKKLNYSCWCQWNQDQALHVKGMASNASLTTPSVISSEIKVSQPTWVWGKGRYTMKIQ